MFGCVASLIVFLSVANAQVDAKKDSECKKSIDENGSGGTLEMEDWNEEVPESLSLLQTSARAMLKAAVDQGVYGGRQRNVTEFSLAALAMNEAGLQQNATKLSLEAQALKKAGRQHNDTDLGLAAQAMQEPGQQQYDAQLTLEAQTMKEAGQHHNDSELSLEERAMKEIEFEVSSASSMPVKNKVVFVLLNFMFGICGVDRCYMGQPCLGVLKALTLGGCGIWYFLDYVVQLVNVLGKAATIHIVGFQATWETSTIQPAFVLDVVFLCVSVGCCLCACCTGLTSMKLMQKENNKSLYTV
jgi:TM2 domain-containing membrane protein YozV